VFVVCVHCSMFSSPAGQDNGEETGGVDGDEVQQQDDDDDDDDDHHQQEEEAEDDDEQEKAPEDLDVSDED
jgi:hypothetical protein